MTSSIMNIAFHIRRRPLVHRARSLALRYLSRLLTFCPPTDESSRNSTASEGGMPLYSWPRRFAHGGLLFDNVSRELR